MEAKETFITILIILILFNISYILSLPATEQATYLTQMAYGSITGLIATVAVITIATGVQIFGSGLNSESIRLLFAIGTILNILFQISFGPLSVGIGLINPLFTVFALSEGVGMWGLFGWFFATGIAISALASGLLAIVSSGS